MVGRRYLPWDISLSSSIFKLVHINLYRKKSEFFTFSSCLLRCIQVGALQILLELRANGVHLVQGPNCGISSDNIRDCILSASKFNSKSFYSHISMSRFGGKQFSAIEKFARRGKQVSRDNIVSALVKCSIAIGSHKSLKCSIEISLAAMRSQYHIAKYENRLCQPCKICSFLDHHNTYL